MTPASLLADLAAYSLQLAFLAIVGGIAAALFRVELPRLRLAYFQGLLALALGLPLLQPRSAAEPGTPVGSIESFLSARPGSPASLSAGELVLVVLAAGALVSLLRLALGFAALCRYRRRGVPAWDLSEARQVRALFRVAAEVALTEDVPGPVTFGIRRPTILLPISFAHADPARQRAVLCHEFLHVQRRDWAVTVLQELLRAILWFHPAVHWLIGRIRLSREQTVDREVVSVLGSRGTYLESLLEMSRVAKRARPLPANLFLGESHLKARVNLLLKEVAMSRTRIVAFLSVSVLVLLATGGLSARAFPLSSVGAPSAVGGGGVREAETRSESQPGAKAGKSATGRPQIIHRVDPVYPAAAKKEGLEGTVVVELTVVGNGTVAEVKVVRGHPAFNQAAVDAVKQWKFAAPEKAPMKLQVTVNFRPDDKERKKSSAA